MAIPRRIIPRDELRGSAIEVTRSADPADPRRTCLRTVTLDGCDYACLREVRSFDLQHDGIHDAFCEHPGDQGAVRW